MQLGELQRGLVEEALEAAGIGELARIEIASVEGELRRDQHRVDAGRRDLVRQLLAVAHVARERRAVAVEEHDHHRRLVGIEAWRHGEQHVVVGIRAALMRERRALERDEIGLRLALRECAAPQAGIGVAGTTGTLSNAATRVSGLVSFGRSGCGRVVAASRTAA